MRTYRLYTATVNSANACSLTIQRTGRIKAIRWSVVVVDATNSHTFNCELSTLPTSQINTHDTVNSIDQYGFYNNVGAAGTDHIDSHHSRLVDYPVAAGERLYLNTAGTATGVYVNVFVDIDD